MRIRFGILYFFILYIIFTLPVYSTQTGGVQYNMPIDYSLINENDLKNEAENLFQAYLQSENEQQKKVLLHKMLSDYSILGEIDTENPLYFTRLGIIYDKIGKDRWAKSNFCKSANLTQNNPYAYYAYGNFFFDRSEYRKALKQYMKAYEFGYNNHYENLYQIGVIYEKLGDFSESIRFFKQALLQKDSTELRNKILKLEELLENNSLYNKKSKVHTK